MSEAAAPRDIEVDADPGFQERLWKVQRLTWGVALIVLVLIALGITGSGPLSRASASGDDGATSADYSRFARRGARTTIRLTLRPTDQPAEEVRIWLDQAAMEDYRLENISPQPDSSTLDGDRVIHSFPVSASDEEIEIFLTLVPQRPGWIGFGAGRVDGATLKISQLVYP